MQNQIDRNHHELDLDLVKQSGYLANNEVKLADKKFLSKKEIAACTEFYFKLQNLDFNGESTLDK